MKLRRRKKNKEKKEKEKKGTLEAAENVEGNIIRVSILKADESVLSCLEVFAMFIQYWTMLKDLLTAAKFLSCLVYETQH